MALPSFEDFKTTTTGGGSTLPSVDNFVTTKKKATESNQEYANFVKFASSMDDDAVANIATQFKNDWDYDEADGEDIDRKNSGKIPKALESSYTSSATDKWLQSRGLPSAKKLEKYIENYNTHVTNKNVTNNAKNDIIEKWNDILAEKGQLSEDDAAAAYWEVANSPDYADYLDYFKSERDIFDKTVSDYDTESEFLEAQSKFDTKDTEYDLFFRDMFDAASNELKKQQEAVTEEEAKHQIAVDARANIVNTVYNNYFKEAVGDANDLSSALIGASAAFKNKGLTPSQNAELRLREQGLTDDEIEEAFIAAGKEIDFGLASERMVEAQRKEREAAENEAVKGILADLTANADAEAVKTVRRIMNAPEGLIPVVQFDNSLEGFERLQAAYADEMPRVNRAENTLREQGYTDEQITAAFMAAGFKRDVENTAAGQNTAAAIAQFFIDNGASKLDAFNAMARNNLRVNSQDHVIAAYTNALAESGMSAEEIALHMDSRTEKELREILGAHEFDPSIQTSKDKQILMTAVSIPIRAALSIASGIVGFADLVSGEKSSEAMRLGEASRWLSNASAKMTNFGRDMNTPLLNIMGDVGSELLRMYATSAAGTALAGVSGASTVASTASSTGLKAVLKNIAKRATSVETMPFVATAMGHYFAEATAMGASRRDATLYAVVAGAGEGVLESLGSSEMFGKMFSSGKMGRLIKNGKGWLNSELGVAGKSLVLSVLGEGIEEGASYYLSGVMKKATFNPEWKFNNEEFWSNVGMGMLIGGLGSAASSNGLAGQLYGKIQEQLDTTGNIDLATFDAMHSALEVEDMPQAKQRTLKGLVLDLFSFKQKNAEAAKATVNIANADADLAERTKYLDNQVELAKDNADRKKASLGVVAKEDASRVVGAANEAKAAEDKLARTIESVESQKVKAEKEHAGVVNNNTQIRDAANADIDAHHVGVVNNYVAQDAAAKAEQILADVEARNAAEVVEGTETTPVGFSVGAATGIVNPEVSRFRTNTLEAFLTDTELALDELSPEEFAYHKTPEKESLETAHRTLNTLGVEKSVEVLADKGGWNGVDFDTAMGAVNVIRKEAEESGDYWMLQNWLKETQGHVTDSAQLMQSIKKYSRTPEGMLIEAQGNVAKAEKKHAKEVAKVDSETKAVMEALDKGATVEEAAAKVKGKGKKFNSKEVATKLKDLTENGTVTKESVRDIIKEAHGLPVLTASDIKAITRYAIEAQTASTDRERQEAAYSAGLIVASKQGEGTLMEKIRAFTYMNMLLNLKTGAKNFMGNLPMFIAETAKDVVATPVDILVSKKTGERTTTIASAERFSVIPAAARKGFVDSIVDLKHDTSTSFLPGRIEYDVRGSTFKSEFLNRMERLVGQYMGIGDRMWAQIAYDGRVAELKALGKDVNSPEVAKDAEMYALERVFQNNSDLAARALKVRNSLGVFGDIVLPFARTPANIADKLLDYSPVGMVRAIAQWGKTAGTDQFNQKLFVDRVGRSLTGTGMLLLGMALAAKGILVNGGDDSEEREAMKNAGVKGYALKLGDAYHSIEWASPVGTLLLMGGVMQKSFSAETIAKHTSAAEIALNGVQESINAFFSNTFLSGVADLIGGDSVGEAITDTSINSTSRIVPSQMGALARIFDKYERDTYDTDPLIAQGKYLLTRIPGLRNLLPEKIATDGTYLENTTGKTIVGRAVENLFDPGNTSALTDDPVHREIYRLSAEGLSGHTLPTAEYRLEWTENKVKTRHKLTAEERREYQQLLGEMTYAAAERVITNSEYANLPDDVRSEKLKNAINNAADTARAQFKGVLKDKLKGGN